MTWWQQPFIQVSLPVMITFVLATWYQSARITDLHKLIDDLRDTMNRRFDAIEKRLSSIDDLLRDHERRITTLEERTSPLRR